MMEPCHGSEQNAPQRLQQHWSPEMSVSFTLVARIRSQIHELMTAQRTRKAHIANVSRCCDPVTAVGPEVCIELSVNRDFESSAEIGMNRAPSTF
jgi:hypothetical protein